MLCVVRLVLVWVLVGWFGFCGGLSSLLVWRVGGEDGLVGGRPEGEGWELLFDGVSLEGFERVNGWAVFEVVDGMIVGRTAEGSPNSFLCTERRFGDFELRFEVRLFDGGLNSGVQVRSNSYGHYRGGRVHGYQVEVSENGNAGFVFDEGRRGWLSRDRSDELARGAFRKGEWNGYRVLCVGDRIRTWVNGVRVADLRDSWTEEGFIGLQVHGVDGDRDWRVGWRNLWVREVVDEGGWESLFDGVSLDGWRGREGGWVVEDGVLARRPGGGYLWSEEAFGDFELGLEFMVSEGCNSGVFFWSDPDNPVQGGFEVQVLDSFGRVGVGVHDCGALYDAAAPRVNAALPAGVWQRLVVRGVGSRVRVSLNGEEVVNVDLGDWVGAGVNPDGSRNKFGRALGDLPRRGHFGLQDHGKPVWFRSLRVKRL